ncbi:hypothetical protein [Cellulophaga sp. L1A9]|uniref:hypothetical protein n=1 Tax=Cellulophaga sp. L1A9 TaxID=2686362 RepID=UPI00131B7AED|nr:hypothetical protein [Cellulophaga sp. L1A9]
MSDHYISIVSEKTNPRDSQELAERIVSYLAEKKIIQKELSDCVLGSTGHKPAENFGSVLEKQYEGFLDSKVNGVEIITERRVFHNSGNGLEGVHCPNCGQNQIEEDWGNALDNWYEKLKSDLVKCSNCSSENSITKFNFEPNWGFGDFGLIFWNWGKFKSHFFTDLEKIIGMELKVVYGKL